MYKCECGKEFEKPNSFNGHKSHCKTHMQINNKYEYLVLSEQKRHLSASKTLSEKFSLKEENDLKMWVNEKHTCEKCGKVMTEKFGSGRFCSRSCANGHIQTEEINLKRKATALKNFKENPDLFITIPTFSLNKSFIWRSKPEEKLFELLTNKLPDYEFKYGYFGKYNGENLIPDIFSYKYKIIIEYDGVFHFKDLFNQLEKKHHKDRLLQEFINNSNYRLIRIDDLYYQSNKLNVDYIINLILNSNEKVIMLGDRYGYLN